MKRKNFEINGIPAVLFGEDSDKVYLFIHGKHGSKEEAGAFAETACGYGYQVIGIDLPGHGERRDSGEELYPWNAVPELIGVYGYIREKRRYISVRANSIGAWLSMLAFKDSDIGNCLFFSPVLDMNKLISQMMNWASVDEKRLEAEKEIETSFGETLSWEYYQYARKNPLTKWNIPTDILYAEKDGLTDIETVTEFSKKNLCTLEIMKNGEHWFHTEEQLAFLREWTERTLKTRKS